MYIGARLLMSRFRGTHRVDAEVPTWLRRTVDRVAREEGVSISALVRSGIGRELRARGYAPLGVVPEDAPPVVGLDEVAVADAAARDGYGSTKPFQHRSET